nr:AEC family transporter [Pseudovibrio flavus]
MNAVLPIFGAVLLGFAGGRIGLFSNQEAQTFNRLVFYALLPPFFLYMVGTAPFSSFEPLYVVGYMAVAVLVNLTTFCITRFVFKRPILECVLFGFMAAFTNHTFFVLPIAQVIYGVDAVLPIVAVIATDTMIMYGITVVILDCASSTSKVNPALKIITCIIKNPHAMSMLAGLGLNLMAVSFDNGLGVFTRFLGDAASPVSLFALGIFLSAQKLTENKMLVTTISCMKLFVLPACAAVMLIGVVGLPPSWTNAGVFAAAGPCGVLPFVLALQYRVNGGIISQVLLVTTFAASITLTTLAVLQGY